MSEVQKVVPAPSPVVQQALSSSIEIFNDNRKPNLVYHNYRFCSSICNQIRAIGQEEKDIASEQIDQAQLAAIFYVLGKVSDHQQALKDAFSFWNAYATKNDLGSNTLSAVKDSISKFHAGTTKTTAAQKLLEDGIHAVKFGQQDEDLMALYKMESISLSKEEISNLDWNTEQYDTLQKINFHYPYSQLTFQPAVNRKILDYAQKIKRNKRNGPKAWEHEKLRKFQNLERRLPGDATQTFFRSNFRVHINLSAIADQKANIMISVNAIMISVIISVLSYRNITETSPMVMAPAAIFLTMSLTSLICAVLSARPKVTRVNKRKMPKSEIQKNIVFFGNFVNLELDEYEEAVDAMFRDSELIYGNMVRDLYFLGKVLDQKYRYLSLSYDVFMVGFIITVITFMVAHFS